MVLGCYLTGHSITTRSVVRAVVPVTVHVYAPLKWKEIGNGNENGIGIGNEIETGRGGKRSALTVR